MARAFIVLDERHFSATLRTFVILVRSAAALVFSMY
jgi:hypothetical protein